MDDGLVKEGVETKLSYVDRLDERIQNSKVIASFWPRVGASSAARVVVRAAMRAAPPQSAGTTWAGVRKIRSCGPHLFASANNPYERTSAQ